MKPWQAFLAVTIGVVLEATTHWLEALGFPS